MDLENEHYTVTQLSSHTHAKSILHLFLNVKKRGSDFHQRDLYVSPVFSDSIGPKLHA